MLSLSLAIAISLDLILGDPQWNFHPVRLVGRMAQRLEPMCRALPLSQPSQGGVFLFLVLAASLLPPWLFLKVLGLLHLEWLGGAIVIYFCLGGKSLAHEVSQVLKSLKDRDMDGAREKLKPLVSRRVDHMDEDYITRSALETLAENFSDALVGTLFYAALGGPLLAWAHRVVNTLDAMVGYKDERYNHFGAASAKLDDILNILPSRLSALILAASGHMMGKDFMDTWEAVKEDAPKDESPNSGWPMSAFAHVLGITLGGATLYGDQWVQCPTMGSGPKPTVEHLQGALSLYWVSYMLSALGALVLGGLMSL
ncbi:MAG: adenosylcobinamide-phosphate synthase CbiB [Thermanaerothrix sp.]|nr:adenosylcobinamide-phosphate synthase CbiB [Thermanaerothrix sp.]